MSSKGKCVHVCVRAWPCVHVHTCANLVTLSRGLGFSLAQLHRLGPHLFGDLRPDWCRSFPGRGGPHDHQSHGHPDRIYQRDYIRAPHYDHSDGEYSPSGPLSGAGPSSAPQQPLFNLSSVFQVAKWTGDFFNKGIYDIHVGLRGVPLLEWETEAEMDK